MPPFTAHAGAGPLPLLPVLAPSTSRRVQQERNRSRLNPVTAALANEAIGAINAMSNSFPSTALTALPSSLLSSLALGRPPGRPTPFNKLHPCVKPLQHSSSQRAVTHVYDACDRFRRGGSGGDGLLGAPSLLPSFDPDHLVQHSSTFSYTSATPARSIVAAAVSLPSQAGTADLFSILPSHIASTYASPAALLRPPAAEGDDVTSGLRRPYMRCPPDQYVLLIRRMLALGMVSCVSERPPVVNGLFGVDKGDGSMRLIIDCRPVNALLVPSPGVDLPTPDLVAGFQVPEGGTLYAAKVDLDNFYHRLRMPRAWWPYFALPPLRAGEVGLANLPPTVMVWPCVTTLPMGFSHAVFLAQTAHEHLVDARVPLLRSEDRLRPGSRWLEEDRLKAGGARGPPPDLSLLRLRHSIYIDDLNLYSLDQAAAEAAQQQYLDVMRSVGLPAKATKVVPPTAEGVECLGVEVHGGRADVGVSVTKLQSLRALTLALLRRGECTGRELAGLLGRWTWAMLVCRPALSIFSAVYRFVVVAGTHLFRLWPSVRRELGAAAALAPLLFRSMRASFAPVVVASDASCTGEGVVRARVTPEVAARVAAAPCTPGAPPVREVAEFVDSAGWATVISHRWRNEEHINVLEARAVLAGVRWALTQPSIVGAGRLLTLVDSSAAAGALRKGRSSSYGLLRPLRTLHAFLLASGLVLHPIWLPSALNPADVASRQ